MDPAQREAGFGFWDFPAAQIPSNPVRPNCCFFWVLRPQKSKNIPENWERRIWDELWLKFPAGRGREMPSLGKILGKEGNSMGELPGNPSAPRIRHLWDLSKISAGRGRNELKKILFPPFPIRFYPKFSLPA